MSRKKAGRVEQDGIFEKDQYDTEDAIYVVALDQSDAIGCFRLIDRAARMISECFQTWSMAGALPAGRPGAHSRFHLCKPKRFVGVSGIADSYSRDWRRVGTFGVHRDRPDVADSGHAGGGAFDHADRVAGVD